jgi:MoaA/NifB/PqqE/SkfB family radical SAM enzyme
MSDWDEVLDGSKIAHHAERVEAWKRGERIAPITIDMALTRTCNYGCRFCAAWYQENERLPITVEVMDAFLADCAELGVRGISLVSDGESTISPAFHFAVERGHALGIDMAVGTNGLLFTREWAERLLPHLTYVRINFSAGERSRYAEIMGVKPLYYDRVCQNIRDMVDVKRERGLPVTIGMQMVLMPEFADQIIPFAKLGKELRPDYAVIKHCSDTADHKLGVDYSKYKDLESALHAAESYSDAGYACVVKWTKIRAGAARSYQRCYGPPFILQISGSGLVAPCGGLFNDRFRKFHIGNIVTERFRDIVRSERYWEVVNYLASDEFDAQKTCDSLCLQHKTNEALDAHMKGAPLVQMKGTPQHVNFI